jgi:hypothetical protein
MRHSCPHTEPQTSRTHVSKSDLVIAEPALLDVGLIRVVRDVAERVVVARRVERAVCRRGAEARALGGGDMVDDDIDLCCGEQRLRLAE